MTDANAKLLAEVIEWDNKSNDGKLQKCNRFNVNALQTSGRVYEKYGLIVVPDDEWDTLEQHVYGYLDDFEANGGDLGDALDRLFDHMYISND